MERLSTVGLLAVTGLDQLLFVLKILFILFTKHATLKRRSTVLSLPLQLGFPAVTNHLHSLVKRFNTSCLEANAINPFRGKTYCLAQ
jgi:hypothetical protein